VGTASTKSSRSKPQTNSAKAATAGGRNVVQASEAPAEAVMSDRTWLIAMAAILFVAAVLRLYDLNLVPLHHDEGVNGNFLVRLVREGYYHYDPANYHGPTLYYFSAIVAWILRPFAGPTANLSTIGIRLVPALFGLATVGLIFTLRRNLGTVATLSAAFLLAVSPGAVYLSRYFIHETLFVFFTLGIVVAVLKYYEDSHPVHLILAALSAGLLFATKETWIVTGGVLLIALISTGLYRQSFLLFAESRNGHRRNGRDSAPNVSEWVSQTVDRLVNSAGYGGLRVSSVAFSFDGRISRGVFWTVWFQMLALSCLVGIVVAILSKMDAIGNTSAIVIYLLWAGLVCWVSVAIYVKRWHDLGYSGWLTLLNLVPGVNLVALFMLGAIEGTAGLNSYGPVASDQPNSPWNKAVVLALWWLSALGVCAMVGVLFYSSFSTNPQGVTDSLKTFQFWTKTGKEAHQHPRSTYIWWLLQQESPLLVLGALGAIVAVLRPSKSFALFSALWAFGLLAAYSLIAYKTPWLALNFIVPLALVSGVAIGWLYEELAKWEISKRARWYTVAGILLIAIGPLAGFARIFDDVAYGVSDRSFKGFASMDVHWNTFIPGHQTIDLNFLNYDNDNRYYVYVYAHTRRETLKLVEEINKVAERTHQGDQTGITIVSPDYWPLPWYLRDYKRVGYHGRMTPSTEPIIIAKQDQAAEVQATFGDRYQQIQSGFNTAGSFPLRPGVDLLLYTRRELVR
jgi:predicted membrane-bound mannosyltransferase/uncharacterized membrane protein YhaH (DUF805 family)